MPVLFTPETARLAGIKSGIARRSEPVVFEEPAANVELIREAYKARTIDERLKVIAEQIASTRAFLNRAPMSVCMECGQDSEMPAHHRAALLKALDALIEREQDLLGIPGRGHRRPPAERGARNIQSRIEPLPDEPCGPGPTTGSVPPTSPKP